MAIPTRIIEGIHNSELNPENYYELYGKEEITAELKKLEESDKEILVKYNSEAMKKAVAKKLNKNKPLLFTSSVSKIVTYAAAAVFLAAIVVPAVTIKSSNTPTERVKGSSAIQKQKPELILYQKNGREIQSLKDGSFARKGDVIQITYKAGQNDYGVIFSVDGNGTVTRHLPDENWNAQLLKHSSEEIPLDFSYELDNAPDFECFIFVFSKDSFSLKDIESKIKNKTDIDYLTKLSYLPRNTDGITFVLEK